MEFGICMMVSSVGLGSMVDEEEIIFEELLVLLLGLNPKQPIPDW